ncbi:Multidrug efflux pump subunit AcrB [Solimonas aquatica]|uniref:Multidrug efflux pump subunit AcrB n=1 Tax=Solimonas aquatica TaxID=489703 RepID=A0A1H9MDR9_9GAMM|nr:efflux RND transporter permease subunit [Solimonas aquatica]SER21605.1 Multidrug efflux pump subunit AcrB [Solimonas aquatica]
MSETPREKLGIAGRIAALFLESRLTPLLAITGVLLGVFALLVTPREEEPQIDVTFANVFIPFPGASAREVEQLVANGAEQVASEISGVDHVYSVSRPGLAMLTVQFKVGQPRTEAIVGLYNAFYEHQDWLPREVGVGPVLIKPKGIDDVPIFALTLWSEQPQLGGGELLRVAHSLEAELKRVPGTRNVYTIGGPERIVQVRLDAQRLAAYGLAPGDLRQALMAANRSADAGVMVREDQDIQVQAGSFLMRPEEVAELVIGMHAGRPVYLSDVAQVTLGDETPLRYSTYCGGAADQAAGGECHPAVTLAVAKKPGENSVVVAQKLLQRFEQLRGVLVPDAVRATVTRNYGLTAEDKAQTLIHKLMFATASVVLLVLFTLGKREAVIVGSAVIVTLVITLFASWAWGFTLNRVSLFALIFSIGILVDDAIVVVENIHRHMQMGGHSLREAIPAAVDEVGGPTILATFTVIAALLPMAFVSGLMGPYMAPIPINASMGMFISLAVAFVLTPWLSLKLLGRHVPGGTHGGETAKDSWLLRLLRQRMTPFLRARQGRGARVKLLLGVIGAIALSVALPVAGLVVLKMLPFDNKSEFQVVVDMPAGSSLEKTQRTLMTLADTLRRVPEVTDVQAYAGTAAPINFNGLVRQYYLRSEAYQGDLQVNLLDRHHRTRKSHEIVRALREPLQKLGEQLGAKVKIVEVPPGPPVISPIVAEIYGLDYARQLGVAAQVEQVFRKTKGIVDIDSTIEAPQQKLIFHVDRARAQRLGVTQDVVVDALNMALRGADLSYLHSEHSKYPIPVRVQLPLGEQADIDALKALRVRSREGALVPIGEMVRIERSQREQSIYHKDLLPVVMVFGDMAGHSDSPLYGMAAISGHLDQLSLDQAQRIEQRLISQPELPTAWSLKWDGEWQITYETFRDMGLAYSVGLVLIYLLVVAQFGSYGLPLIIMAPIPLTLIGILPGHALLGREFTATSMIGMIALAGIIVRNSILLVDFVRQAVARGVDLQEAVIQAAAERARPIVLTGLAAMIGATFILDDPIFSGLSVSLIFGIFVSTLLTVFVIPVVYYAYHYQAQGMSRG